LFSKKKKGEEKMNLYYITRGLQGVGEGAKGTLTFTPTSISSSPHLPPSFLVSLSPHYTSFSKIVFSIGDSVFSTRGSCRNYREPKMSIEGSLRDKKSFMRNL